MKTKNSQHSFLKVERYANASLNESIIKTNDHKSLSFKSEYAYLFSIIYAFHQTPNDSFDFLYHLPNTIRRFLETYLHFKHMSSLNIEEHIHLLFDCSIERERVTKFVHHGSHSLTTTKLEKFPEVSELKEVVRIVLTAIETKDLVHYNALKSTVIAQSVTGTP